MRIKVKGNGHNIMIPVPTGLIFSKPSAWLYVKFFRSHSGCAKQYVSGNVDVSLEQFFSKLPEEAVYALCAEIMRIKRIHGRWDLVEIHGAHGEEVCITL